MIDHLRRAFVSVTPAPADRVELDPEESHHVARVLRLAAGDALAVFDGKGGEWEATIATCSRAGVTVVVGEPRAGESEPRLRVTVFQALSRPEKLEWVLQKGTEIGVSAFRLIASDRVEAPPPSPSRFSRYERIVMEACKQCGRRVLPELAMGSIVPPGTGVLAIILAHGAGVVPLASLLSGPEAAEVWLAVGPEGGFTERELEAASAAGWRRASLGPRVLRTETAGVVAPAIVLHASGDLGR